MAKPKAAPKVAFNVRLDPSVYNALQERRVSEGSTITAIVDAALRQYLRMEPKRK
jgi:hypothetical protein